MEISADDQSIVALTNDVEHDLSTVAQSPLSRATAASKSENSSERVTNLYSGERPMCDIPVFLQSFDAFDMYDHEGNQDSIVIRIAGTIDDDWEDKEDDVDPDQFAIKRCRQPDPKH